MAENGFTGIHRDEWHQLLPRAEVRRACTKKRKFHETRVRYWLSMRKKAEAKFKKAGMKLVPNLGLSTQAMYSVESNKREVATVDHRLLQDWQNYNTKAEQHKAQVAEYRKWEKFLTEARSAYSGLLQLTFKDCEFFGIITEVDDKESE